MNKTITRGLIEGAARRMGDRPLIVHSGGQDSTTCLMIASKFGCSDIHTVSFDYGQRHQCELDCAKHSAAHYGATQHPAIKVPFLQNNVTSELLASATGDVRDAHAYLDKRPASFVPARNALFLTMAFGLAMELKCTSVVTGVCQADEAGYPDCRATFIKQLDHALNVGYEQNIPIIAPLVYLNKAETFWLAYEAQELDYICEHTHTCYNGDHVTRSVWGYGCGGCPSCAERARGYMEFRSETV